MARVVSIAGGKQGIGRTFVSTNLAYCLSERGYRTCLLFTDPEYSQDSLPIQVSPRGDMAHVLNGEAALIDIITKGGENLDVIISGNAFADGQCIEPRQVKRVTDSFFHAVEYDFFIIDTPAGPSDSTVSFCRAASESVLVLTPEPPVITSAYALIKACGSKGFTGRMAALVNQSKNPRISDLAVTKLKDSARKSFNIEMLHLGNIVKDGTVARSAISRRIFVQQSPDSPAAADINNIADRLLEAGTAGTEDLRLEDFWKTFFVLCGAGGALPESPPGDATADDSALSVPPLEAPLEAEAPPGPEAETDLSEDILGKIPRDHFSLLAQSLASLTKELRALRNSFEDRNLSLHATPTRRDKAPLEKIELDFDSFLSDRLK